MLFHSLGPMVVAISSLAVDTSYRLTAIFAWETVSCSTSPKFKINFAWLNRVWASDRSRKRKSERAEDGWSRVVAVSVVRASSRCLHIQTGEVQTTRCWLPGRTTRLCGCENIFRALEGQSYSCFPLIRLRMFSKDSCGEQFRSFNFYQ